jgi:DNA-nicking Smr family endonuclease
MKAAGDDPGQPTADEPVNLPIDGTLDLHMFTPRDVKSLVPEYIEACLARGILDLRIVHGKGIGTLRTIVHGILEKHPAVVWYGHAEGAGSWGATLVTLAPPEPGRRAGQGRDGGS